MGKKPLTQKQVTALRVITQHKPLEALLLNLGTDLMLRSSDLLGLRVRDVLTESMEVRDTVAVRQQKTGRGTIELPLSDDSKDAITRHVLGRSLNDYVFTGRKFNLTKKPICIQTYARIIKKWMRLLSVGDVSRYSTHSMRKTKASIIYDKTGNVEAVRRLLGHKSVMDTSRYLGVEDADATELARNIKV